MNLAIVKSKPNPQTGQIRVTIPTKTGKEELIARPKKSYLGIVKPYKLGDIVVVEEIEGRLYYSDQIHTVNDYSSNTPDNSYSFVTPFGYIAFTEQGVEIKHKNGGRIYLTNKEFKPETVYIEGTGTKEIVTTQTGTTTDYITKWR